MVRMACLCHNASQMLEPHVANASSVAWQILKRHKAFKVVNGQMLHSIWLGHPEVYCHGPLALIGVSQEPPEYDPCTLGAEVVLNVRAANISAGVSRGCDLLVLVAVGPKSAPSSARCAIARGRRVQSAFEGP